MRGDTDTLTRAEIRAALVAAQQVAEAEFDPWWSGYLCGAGGDNVEHLLQRLALHLGRPLRDREELAVRRGHAGGLQDYRDTVCFAECRAGGTGD